MEGYSTWDKDNSVVNLISFSLPQEFMVQFTMMTPYVALVTIAMESPWQAKWGTGRCQRARPLKYPIGLI